jgi:ABC-type sugar transport system substrate-binding protein
MDVTQNLLQAHPNVKALWAANDEMALGALEAIDAAGLTGQIIVAGIDATGDGRDALRAGRLAITCSTDPFMQGYYAVQAAAAFLNGDTLPERYSVPIRVLSSVAELDDLEASS